MKTLIMTLSSIFLLSGCMNEFKFHAENVGDDANTPSPNDIARNPGDNPDAGNSPKPKDPIVDPDHPNVTPVTYKKGECTKDPVSVVPCMSCQILLRPIDIPLSAKATQLLKILESGCAVLNKSDPAGYVPPTRRQLLEVLNRANTLNYPDSTPTARQKFNLDKWVNNDGAYLSILFGGLWYHPPFSDDFETYFGLEPKEARYFFCYNDPESSFSANTKTEIHSLGYQQCAQENFSGNCRETKEYVQANVFRTQLLDSINKSINDPFNDQEMIPVNKCLWETMSGFYNAEMDGKLIDWKNKGFELAVYYESDHARCEGISTARIPLNTRVTIAGRLCTKF